MDNASGDGGGYDSPGAEIPGNEPDGIADAQPRAFRRRGIHRGLSRQAGAPARAFGSDGAASDGEIRNGGGEGSCGGAGKSGAAETADPRLSGDGSGSGVRDPA